MSWGYRIALLYGGCVVLILGLAFAAIRQDYHLVTEDYYGEELKHDDHMIAISNSNSLAEGLDISYAAKEKELRLQFPQGMKPSGKVALYRPSNSGMDKEFDIQADQSGKHFIDGSSLQKGLWRVQVNWNSSGKAYYYEKSIVVQ